MKKEKRQTGYIYGIKSHQNDNVYIGSTFGTLRQRLYMHKHTFKNVSQAYCSSFEIVKFIDAYIELIEKYENVSKIELQKHERDTIKSNLNCVNKVIPRTTNINYEAGNRERIKEWYREYNSAYAINHASYLREKQATRWKNNETGRRVGRISETIKIANNNRRRLLKYKCECGKELSLANKQRHIKVCKIRNNNQ